MSEEAQEGRDAFKDKRPRLLAVPEAAVTDLATCVAGARTSARHRAGLVGAAAASHLVWWRLGAALLVAVGLGRREPRERAFDGMKGVDTAERVGPLRLTQTGAARRGRCSWPRWLRSRLPGSPGWRSPWRRVRR
jgi:hypothetical protein